ncbi:hypothetical protein M9H77_27262 [Catharanthus roseus]|uniref:Uncharacterized protein n=1 Tax=Catharanthus roseus TaxID=4058 RepID=A0ACC0AE61_CATRO|nr:hypothetical protein M9H77_27262 [Catharanthus roseus]
MRNTGYDPTKKRAFRYPDKDNQVWIPLSEDRMRDRNLQPVENDDEADESYNLSDDEEDEAGAQNMVLIDAFLTEMRAAFEKLWITQEIQGMQLMEMVESTRRYANKLAHKRASIDPQEVMLARLYQRFMPDQGSNGGGGTDFGPQ